MRVHSKINWKVLSKSIFLEYVEEKSNITQGMKTHGMAGHDFCCFSSESMHSRSSLKISLFTFISLFMVRSRWSFDFRALRTRGSRVGRSGLWWSESCLLAHFTLTPGMDFLCDGNHCPFSCLHFPGMLGVLDWPTRAFTTTSVILSRSSLRKGRAIFGFTGQKSQGSEREVTFPRSHGKHLWSLRPWAWLFHSEMIGGPWRQRLKQTLWEGSRWWSKITLHRSCAF